MINMSPIRGRFKKLGQNIIIDTITNLMWERKANHKVMTWKEAKKYCEELSLGEYDDWRLPNLLELQSIVDYTKYDPSRHPIFLGLPFNYWTNTPYLGSISTNTVWTIHFGLGHLYGVHKSESCYKSENCHVRAVRDRLIIPPVR